MCSVSFLFNGTSKLPSNAMALLTKVAPTLDQKLSSLSQAASFDLSCACGTEPSRTRGADGRWIYPKAFPSGQGRSMLKVLQQGGCDRDCAYCAQRSGGIEKDPLDFSPEELARTFHELYTAGRVFGLFLSSAIRGSAISTMDRMLATAEILRRRFRFRGYLHMKILPGAKPDQVEQAMKIATRVSVNMEAPTAQHLALVAPFKAFQQQILAPMRQVARAEREGRFRRSGQTTQFVVGASGETDQEIARAADWLYRRLGLKRVYYSGFQPVAGTPLEAQPPAPFMREHRLYQLDFLLRSYHFQLEEIPFTPAGQLSLKTDPKTLWAKAHPERFPVEVNQALAEELVRVPGLGPRSSQWIVKMRREQHFKAPRDLRASGARWRIAAPFLLFDGKMRQVGCQLELFPELH